MERSDAEIERAFLDDLAAIYPETRGIVTETQLLRLPRMLPYAAPGRAALQPALDRPLGRIHLAGDYLGGVYVETAIGTGHAAAQAIRRVLRARARLLVSRSVAVVGSGVIGLACAWELHRGGAEVTVLERGTIGGGASLGNTGWVVPSMTSPLPAPGMVREGIRQLVTRGDAFVLRPSLDPSFVRWLWRFWRSSTPTRFDAGIEALLALNRRTLELFDAYRDAGLDFEMVESGLLVVARTQEGLEHYRHIFARLRTLGYEGSEPVELDAAARGGARAGRRPLERRRRPARTRRPLRPARDADARRWPTGSATRASRWSRARLSRLFAARAAAGRSQRRTAIAARTP